MQFVLYIRFSIMIDTVLNMMQFVLFEIHKHVGYCNIIILENFSPVMYCNQYGAFVLNLRLSIMLGTALDILQLVIYI